MSVKRSCAILLSTRIHMSRSRAKPDGNESGASSVDSDDGFFEAKVDGEDEVLLVGVAGECERQKVGLVDGRVEGERMGGRSCVQ